MRLAPKKIFSFFLPALAGMVLSVSPAHATMEDYPEVTLKALDKSTARTTTLQAKVGETFDYGPLHIRVQACRKSPPIETPESAAFLQIWEVPPETGKSEWVFSGWMFASSPALSAMDHPVYDIWVIDCAGKEPDEEAAPSEKVETATPNDATAPETSAEHNTQSELTPPQEQEKPENPEEN